MTMIDTDLDRPIWGAQAFAQVLNTDTASVNRMLQKRLLPARKVGRKWVSTPRQLLAAVTPLESGK